MRSCCKAPYVASIGLHFDKLALLQYWPIRATTQPVQCPMLHHIIILKILKSIISIIVFMSPVGLISETLNESIMTYDHDGCPLSKWNPNLAALVRQANLWTEISPTCAPLAGA